MNRHQLGGLFFDPGLRLLVTAARAVTIAAGAAHPVFATTAVAPVVDTPEGTGATADDAGEDFLLAGRKRLPNGRGVLAQRVGNRRHRGFRFAYGRRKIFSIAWRARVSAVSVRCR